MLVADPVRCLPSPTRRHAGYNWVQSALVAVTCLTATPTAACPGAPPPVRDLDIPPFYASRISTRIDPAQKARHDAAIAPLTAFLTTVSRNADKAISASDPATRTASAACALTWLDTWARGNAWLGVMANRQSEYQRKWDLAGAALAYLKLKPYASPQQRGIIEPWLDRFAARSRADFDDWRQRRNNHWYWLGLGLAGTALATDNERHWSEARRIMHDAAREIRVDGALPQELARGRRAIHYHAFSVMPLVLLAELGALKGEDWYSLNKGGLHRLVALTVRGYADPAIFEKLSGIPQHHTRHSSGTGWLPLYKQRFPDRLPANLAADLWPMQAGHRWTGGDVLLLLRAMQRAR